MALSPTLGTLFPAFALALSMGLHESGLSAGPEPSPAVDYARDVRPVLSRRCFACHGPDEEARESDLRLDVAEGLFADLGGYTPVVPGDPDDSELFYRVTSTDDPMPPEEHGPPLAADEIELLRRWIEAGAEVTDHWSFVPPRRHAAPELPDAAGAAWRRDPLDAFVLGRLEGTGLLPSPPAPAHVLARRVALDLSGLPPDPEAPEVQAFLAHPSDATYSALVDALLAAPSFGEHWASPWLDLARYADSKGHGSDPLRTIWPWRDWVVDALNENMPYDEFGIQQLAGDLLASADDRTRLATAFHRNTLTNTEGGTDDEEFRVAAVKDRIETTAQAFMGLTLGCAQCHAHKFDPISQEEYTAWFAIFNQTEDADRPDDSPLLDTPTPEEAARRDELQARIEASREAQLAVGRDQRERLEAALQEAWAGFTPLPITRVDRWVHRAPGSTAGHFSIEPGGVVAPSGDAEGALTLELEVRLDTGLPAALRLDALPSPELPGGGPGHSGSGNFVLSELELSFEPDDLSPARGRYVRVELPGQERMLSLAEVEVVVAEEDDPGPTPSRDEWSASQSSTGYGGDAERAIDGNTDGRYDEESTTHTRRETDPFWELDLHAEREVERIVLWNRVEHFERLHGARVLLLDEQRRAVRAFALPSAPKGGEPARLEAGGPFNLGLTEPDATYAQQDWPIAAAVDGDGSTGWAIAPRTGEEHRAVFPVEESFRAALPGPGILRVRLRQEYGRSHALGRLRLLGLDESAGVVPPAVTPELERALAASSREESVQERIDALALRLDPDVAAQRREQERLEDELTRLELTRTPVLVELAADERRETRLMRRGNFLDLGDVVEPGVPERFLAPNAEMPRDRLAFARWLFAPENPLTARVAVNRFWARLFGRGLVVTEEDFGSQGELPSHPYLLDELALAFVESGWDVKALLRRLVHSATYRQASKTSPEREALDPDNRLLARGPRVRLDAEAIRDQALFLSGLLSPKLGGPPVFPHQPSGLWQAAFNGADRTWEASEGEDRYRRGLYTFLRRTSPYPARIVMDGTSRETCTVRRVRTNTPLQALVTLNDPVYVEAARALGSRMLAAGRTPEERLRAGFERCLLRAPSEEELHVLLELYRGEHARFTAAPEAARALLELPPEGAGESDSTAELAERASYVLTASVLLNLDALWVKE